MQLNLSLLLPEWVVVGTLMLILFAEILKGKESLSGDAGAGSSISFIWIPIALLSFLAVIPYTGRIGVAFGGMFIMDSFAGFFKAFFALVFVVILWMSHEFFVGRKEKTAEFLLILWSILVGLFFLASSNHFLLLFIALELVTLSFYILASYLKHEISAIESGLKYLVMGSLASAFLIFGIALLYVGVGSLDFVDVRQAFNESSEDPLLILAFLFILSGLSFKVAAVPFQLWVPDVYQGAPTPVVAFLSVASKTAGFVLLMRLLFTVFISFEPRLVLFSVLAAATVVYGNLGAILQTNIKRLFGYSSIGHAGYLLMGIAVGGQAGLTALLYYLMAYAVTSLAAFFVITLVGRHVQSDEITAYTGLSKRSPFLAATLFIALLSLAGIPPLAGFFGKFLLLLSVVHSGPQWLALLGLLGVSVSLYYYLNIIRVMYVGSSTHDSNKIEVSRSSKLIMGILVLSIFMLGVWQEPFLRFAAQAVSVLF